MYTLSVQRLFWRNHQILLAKEDVFLIQNWAKVVFQLEFVSISRVINHMTCYKFSALIGWNYSIQTREQIL